MPNAVLTFVDSNGTPTTPPEGDGSGLLIDFTSDNPAITIGEATPVGNTAVAPITGTGTFDLGATVANESGAPLNDDDGTTAFVEPTSVSETITPPPPGQAVTAVLSIED